ncbi:MAG: glycosyltransferase family 2 protein [Nostocaceae cyanobacterium]|nr:glycosyltransferase family 2 protein [Nostocaceae cyanobacterium]
MSISPEISVVVPAYNVRDYIADALLSLESQTFENFEVLVVDDGSTDDTAEVVKPFIQRDARFRLLHKPNGGLSSARNFGIRHAKGKYIALLDGDDTYAPAKLATHVAVLEKFTDVGVVYSASRIMRDDGRLTWMSLSGKPIKSDPLKALLCKNFVGHGSNAVFRREIVDQVGEFDEGLRSSEDVDFWLRVAATRRWCFYREKRALSYYRVRPSGLSFNVAQMQRSNEQVLEAAYHRTPEVVKPMLPTAYAYMYRYLARLSLQGGSLLTARKFIDQAWECDRSIFYSDIRSLLTLISVLLAPIAKLAIGRSLGAIKSPQQ